VKLVSYPTTSRPIDKISNNNVFFLAYYEPVFSAFACVECLLAGFRIKKLD